MMRLYRRRSRWVGFFTGAIALFAVVILLLASSKPTLADRVPGTSYFGPGYYFSTEMDLITVSFWSAKALRAGIEPGMQPLVRIKIPRGFIFYADVYPQKQPRKIPREIDVRRIGVMLVYPDGRPYSIAYRDFDRGSLPAGSNLEKELRTVRFSAIVSGMYKGDKNRQLYEYRRSPFDENGKLKNYHEYIGRKYGLDAYKWGGKRGRIIKYYSVKEDSFSRIECNISNKPRSYCTYYMEIAGQFLIDAHFIDFRFHGGREFANERVRAFKRALCPYLGCLTGGQ